MTVWSKYSASPLVAPQVFARILKSESQDLITHADVWMTQGLLDSLCTCTIGSWLPHVALLAQGKAPNVHQEPDVYRQAEPPASPGLQSRIPVISSNLISPRTQQCHQFIVAPLHPWRRAAACTGQH